MVSVETSRQFTWSAQVSGATTDLEKEKNQQRSKERRHY